MMNRLLLQGKLPAAYLLEAGFFALGADLFGHGGIQGIGRCLAALTFPVIFGCHRINQLLAGLRFLGLGKYPGRRIQGRDPFDLGRRWPTVGRAGRLGLGRGLGWLCAGLSALCRRRRFLGTVRPNQPLGRLDDHRLIPAQRHRLPAAGWGGLHNPHGRSMPADLQVINAADVDVGRFHRIFPFPLRFQGAGLSRPLLYSRVSSSVSSMSWT